MAGSALRRLMAEYRQLTLNPPEGIIAGPVSEENFFEWEALIMGPEGTCFEGGVFLTRLMFPPDYPLSPPKMKFNSEIFHPNKPNDESAANVDAAKTWREDRQRFNSIARKTVAKSLGF
ncbi:Hypothetical predicted protein [Octopus vulgaris]|uniref:UBC core domain-containing protein n=1 Tax=Octopus vulgaris TaxID=6645 RepID=A0AA36B3T5_OCTVU|nr:Hypothetical predicted protein [Octopus vulgaris]